MDSSLSSNTSPLKPAPTMSRKNTETPGLQFSSVIAVEKLLEPEIARGIDAPSEVELQIPSFDIFGASEPVVCSLGPFDDGKPNVGCQTLPTQTSSQHPVSDSATCACREIGYVRTMQPQHAPQVIERAHHDAAHFGSASVHPHVNWIPGNPPSPILGLGPLVCSEDYLDPPSPFVGFGPLVCTADYSDPPTPIFGSSPKAESTSIPESNSCKKPVRHCNTCMCFGAS
jgi:hypothetical protein